jgi:hypothetical protein
MPIGGLGWRPSEVASQREAPRLGTIGCFWRRFIISRRLVTWRALPARFGHWNSVWKRFSRLSKAGVLATYFALLAALSDMAHLARMADSTVVRAPVSAPAQKGAGKPGDRPLARRLQHQDPPEDRSSGPTHRVLPHRRRKERRAPLRDAARSRSRHHPSRGRRRQGIRRQSQSRRPPKTRRLADYALSVMPRGHPENLRQETL